MPHLALATALTLMITPVHAAPNATTGNSAHDVTGIWRSIDDKTGLPKAIIRIEKASNGTYGGTILKMLPGPDGKVDQVCIDCPAPFTGKALVGMNLLWDLKADQSDAGNYTEGQIIDPLSGHIYSAKMHLSADGRELNVRGYLGISLLGRSQVWHREE